MKIIITGGAGYIGSHCVRMCLGAGHDVAVIDNLSRGHILAVDKGARFYCGDISRADFLDWVFSREQPDAVIHFAAHSQVGESMSHPQMYFDNNVAGSLSLLSAMQRANVRKIVFSSTAAVYGEPETIPITEDCPTVPTNPYGESKLMIERMMRWFSEAYGLRFVALRYFNVAGADAGGDIGEDHRPETHLIPIVLNAAASGKPVRIFGGDYDTPDGTCVRDYIHVTDLVRAHLGALDYLTKGGDCAALNLGIGKGFSVREIISAAESALGITLVREESPRRAGDPAILIASGDHARKLLDWEPQYTDVSEIIKTAWSWHKSHPNGYDE